MSKNTQFRILISSGLLSIMIINMVIFPSIIAQLEAVSIQVETVFDLSFFYTPDQAYAKIANFGKQGVPIIHKLAIVDFIYIIIYSFTYYFLLKKFIPRAFSTHHSLKKLAFFPFVIGGLDIFENIGYTILIQQYPERLDALAYCTTFFTIFKWCSVGLVVLFGVVVLVRIIKKVDRPEAIKTNR